MGRDLFVVCSLATTGVRNLAKAIIANVNKLSLLLGQINSIDLPCRSLGGEAADHTGTLLLGKKIPRLGAVFF
jgi:hypothetical protein